MKRALSSRIEFIVESYATFYSKERQTGKEARWKQQLVSLERPTQAATLYTAKKQSSIPAEMEEISKQLEHQTQEARQTMDTMKQSMANPAPYVQEMQQQMMTSKVYRSWKSKPHLRRNIEDADILTARNTVRATEEEAAKQTVT